MLKRLLFLAAMTISLMCFAEIGIISDDAVSRNRSVLSGSNLLSDAVVPTSLSTKPKASTNGAISRVEDIAGSYLMYFTTPISNTVVDYTEVTVAKKDATHITIDGFWKTSASTLTASVNLADGTISIPSQKVYVSSEFGECDLAPWYIDEENGNKVTPVRSEAIPGRVDGDKIILDTYAWGVFINAGTHKDDFMMLGTHTDFFPVNGEDETVRLNDGTRERNAVVITLDGNDIIVKNFAGFGREVIVTMESDRMNVHVDKQTIYSYYDNSAGSTVDYQCYALTDDGKVSTTKKVTGTVTKQEVNLGKWALLIKNGVSSYSGIAFNSYKLYFTDGSTFNAAGIDGATADEAVSVRYYNLQGLESERPFRGLNIVKEIRTDGSTTTKKRVF